MRCPNIVNKTDIGTDVGRYYSLPTSVILLDVGHSNMTDVGPDICLINNIRTSLHMTDIGVDVRHIHMTDIRHMTDVPMD